MCNIIEMDIIGTTKTSSELLHNAFPDTMHAQHLPVKLCRIKWPNLLLIVDDFLVDRTDNSNMTKLPIALLQ